jgi:hypothetical protein
MFYFKDYSDPIGTAQRLDSVESMLEALKRAWDETRTKKSLLSSRVSFTKVTSFLLYSLDGLVNAVNEAVLTGPDKKATVLDAIDRLYDYTVREALPIWLVPVAMPIKSYVIHVLVSNAIDWIVAKYKEGSWGKKEAPASARRRVRRSK